MEQVFSIQLWRDDRQEQYCGCWNVPCEDGDPYVARLTAAKVGHAREEDGSVSRAFFFADELAEQVRAAERTTECVAEEVVLERGRSMQELNRLVAEGDARFDRLGEVWSSLTDEEQEQLAAQAEALAAEEVAS